MIVQVLGAGISAAAFSIIFNVRGRNIAFAGISGGIGFFVYLLCLPLDAFAATVVASASISLYAEIMARVRKTPATLFLVAGMIPIVPGGAMYNCMLLALEGELTQAAVTGYQALLQAGAIAIGIIAVSSVVKLIPRKW